jgi:hypothetical protein
MNVIIKENVISKKLFEEKIEIIFRNINKLLKFLIGIITKIEDKECDIERFNYFEKFLESCFIEIFKNFDENNSFFNHLTPSDKKNFPSNIKRIQKKFIKS